MRGYYKAVSVEDETKNSCSGIFSFSLTTLRELIAALIRARVFDRSLLYRNAGDGRMPRAFLFLLSRDDCSPGLFQK